MSAIGEMLPVTGGVSTGGAWSIPAFRDIRGRILVSARVLRVRIRVSPGRLLMIGAKSVIRRADTNPSATGARLGLFLPKSRSDRRPSPWRTRPQGSPGRSWRAVKAIERQPWHWKYEPRRRIAVAAKLKGQNVSDDDQYRAVIGILPGAVRVP
jgi:hypothetical protein